MKGIVGIMTSGYVQMQKIYKYKNASKITAVVMFVLQLLNIKHFKGMIENVFRSEPFPPPNFIQMSQKMRPAG